jgi:hypothetical protein
MVWLGFWLGVAILNRTGCHRRYRKWIVADLQLDFNKRTKAERVLALVIESGVLYIFSDSIMVAASVIRLPRTHYVLESLYSQATVHLAGIYPLVVVILVHREASMDKTLSNSTLQYTPFQASPSIASPAASRQLKPGFQSQGPFPAWRSLDGTPCLPAQDWNLTIDRTTQTA